MVSRSDWQLTHLGHQRIRNARIGLAAFLQMRLDLGQVAQPAIRHAMASI